MSAASKKFPKWKNSKQAGSSVRKKTDNTTLRYLDVDRDADMRAFGLHFANTLERCVKGHIERLLGRVALGDGMIQRDIYLMNAALLFAKAEAEKDSAIKADFENMARAYLRLADQAERNAHNDVVYETPPPPKDRDQL